MQAVCLGSGSPDLKLASKFFAGCAILQRAQLYSIESSEMHRNISHQKMPSQELHLKQAWYQNRGLLLFSE